MAAWRTFTAACLALLLAAVLSACTAPRPGAEGQAPATLAEAGQAVSTFARSVDGVASFDVLYSAPGGQRRSGALPLSTPRWGATLRLTLRVGVDTATAMVAARRVANYVSQWETGFGWIVEVQDCCAKAVTASVYESQPSEEDLVVRAGTVWHFAQARSLAAVPGVDSISIDTAGQVAAGVASYKHLPAVAAALHDAGFDNAVLKLQGSSVELRTGGYRAGAGILGLMEQLGTTLPLESMAVVPNENSWHAAAGGRAPSNFLLMVSAGTKEEAQGLERAILSAELGYTAGDAAVRSYQIPYGEPVDTEYGDRLRESLSGELNHATPLPAADAVPAPPAREASQAADAPLCAPDQLEWTAQQMPAPSMGFTGMGVFLSNIGMAPCSLDGYPALEFADSDGDAIPVVLAQGFLEARGNAAPVRVVIGPGEQAVAAVQWRTNQVDGYSRLPSTMAVEAVAGTGFTRASEIFVTTNIIDDSEVRLSPWQPADQPLPR